MKESKKMNYEIDMMTIPEQEEAINQLKGWELVSSFSVGGFLYFGLPKQSSNKIIIISSKKSTILDCDTGLLEDCEVDYDVESYFAICESVLDEFSIAGQYGGTISHHTNQGDYVDIKIVGKNVIGNKELEIEQISFIDKDENSVVIYRGYLIYICGFTCDGNYFVFADDGWVYVLKRV